VLRLFIAPTFLLTSIHPQEDSEELGGIAVGSSSCAGEMEDFLFLHPEIARTRITNGNGNQGIVRECLPL
jgi:hypothetical protein